MLFRSNDAIGDQLIYHYICTYNTNPQSIPFFSLNCQPSEFFQGCNPYKESYFRKDLWLPYSFPRERLIISANQELVITTNLKTLFLIWFPADLILPNPLYWRAINGIHEDHQGHQLLILYGPHKMHIPMKDPIGDLHKICHTCLIFTADPNNLG